MDRHVLELNLCEARARAVQGQQALLRQRQLVRELEQNGLDAEPAKALLRVYEQTQAMNLFDRDRLRHALAGKEAANDACNQPAHDVIDLQSLERKAA